MSQTSKKTTYKQDRYAQRQLEAKRRKQWARIGWSAAGLVVIGCIAVLAMNRAPSPGEKIEVLKDQSHIPTVDSPHTPYNSDPPTSGPHMANIAGWGVHKQPVPKEYLVHNLEDAGVVIYYNDKLDADSVKKLETIVEGYPEFVLVNPYPAMGNVITLTAWGRMLRLDQLDEKQVKDFINAYKGIDHHPRQ